ncbi:hypothetical protein OH77DRAFT_951499 [Trametes cingulata]|nr:hypothetical protein OH77DRAFT_951499 [Trametes cingulata]
MGGHASVARRARSRPGTFSRQRDADGGVLNLFEGGGRDAGRGHAQEASSRVVVLRRQLAHVLRYVKRLMQRRPRRPTAHEDETQRLALSNSTRSFRQGPSHTPAPSTRSICVTHSNFATCFPALACVAWSTRRAPDATALLPDQACRSVDSG